MTLIAVFPDGGEMRLSASQIVAVSPELLTVILPLNERGLWTFRLVAADGQKSNGFAVKVE